MAVEVFNMSRRPSGRQCRAGTVGITVHYPEPVRRQLKALAVDEGRTMDDAVAEALNLLFRQHGRPEIAPRRAPRSDS